MVGGSVFCLLVVGRGVLALLAMVDRGVRLRGVLGLGVLRARGVLGLLATVGLPVIDRWSLHRLGGALSAARRNRALALLGNPGHAIVRKQGDARVMGQMGRITAIHVHRPDL